MAPEDHDDSTPVRHGKVAFSMADMRRFMRELEARPFLKLLSDLPGLMELPDAKYSIVKMALTKRMQSSDSERQAVEEHLVMLQKVGSALARHRCTRLLEPQD